MYHYTDTEGMFYMVTIAFSSVTYATKAKRALASISISSRLIKIDNTVTSNGCTYGLLINNNEYLSAVRCLMEKNIAYTVFGG